MHELYKLNNKQINVPVNFLYISHSEYEEAEWHSTLHSHHFTELFYIKNGSGSFVFGDNTRPVFKNDFVIINPNIQHTEISSETNSLEYITLGFEGFSFSLFGNNFHNNGVHIHSHKNNQIIPILNTIFNEAKDKKEDYERVCQNLLEILIITIIREGNYTLNKVDSKRINSNIFATRNYIDQNFKKDISLEELANISHMSKYYMAHSFKDAFGIPPIEYLNSIRINEAKVLLETTNYAISEISDLIGFSSQSYFSQSFKNELNITPSKYRAAKK